MYPENLEPLLAVWPVIAAILGLAVMGWFWSIWSARRPARNHAKQVRKYRERELKWRSQIQRSAIEASGNFEERSQP